MPRNPNLEDPDHQLRRILEQQYVQQELKAEWLEHDENFEKRLVTRGTNIDTRPSPADQVVLAGRHRQSVQIKSPSQSQRINSQEQSFNQSPFKQTDSTFSHHSTKERRNAYRSTPHGLGNDDDDYDGGLPFFSNSPSRDEKEFYFYPEHPSTIVSLSGEDRNVNDGWLHRVEDGGRKKMDKNSSVFQISHHQMGRTLLVDSEMKGHQHHQSADSSILKHFSPSRPQPPASWISMSGKTSLTPLKMKGEQPQLQSRRNDATTLAQTQNQYSDNGISPRNRGAIPIYKYIQRSLEEPELQATASESSQDKEAEGVVNDGGTNHDSNSFNETFKVWKENSASSKNLVFNSTPTVQSSPDTVAPGPVWVERDMSQFKFQGHPKYARVISVKAHKRRTVIIMLSQKKGNTLDVTAKKIRVRNKIGAGRARSLTENANSGSQHLITKPTMTPVTSYYQDVENVTCLTFPVIAKRKLALRRMYHKQPGTCPTAMQVTLTVATL